MAARFAGDRLQPQSRRAVIKTRLVVLASTSPRAVQTHLRYIARDGVMPEGAPAVVDYSRATTAISTPSSSVDEGIAISCRFIIAPENPVELENLHTFARELMARMEIDVGWRLDWVASTTGIRTIPIPMWCYVDGHEAGHDPVLAREYIACAFAQVNWRQNRSARAKSNRPSPYFRPASDICVNSSNFGNRPGADVF